jgi:hypothetical protein
MRCGVSAEYKQQKRQLIKRNTFYQFKIGKTMIAQQPAKTHINLTIYPSKSDVIDSFRSLSLFFGRRSDGSSEITALAVLAIRIAFVPRLISLVSPRNHLKSSS